MKCPKCDIELKPAVRHELTVNCCPSCKGMWFEGRELEELEDEVFDFGEHAKGTLVVDATPTADKCPQCSASLQRFRYRFYDLQMELCPSGHGYWLEDNEDARVLELMEREEQDLKRKLRAEDRWASLMKHLRSRSFFDRVRDLFR